MGEQTTEFMENHGLLPEINLDLEHADRPCLFLRLVATDEHVVRYNALQHIALGQTEHTMQSLLKCCNVCLFPLGDMSVGRL